MMPRSFFASAVALVLILATGSAMARISGPFFDLVELARAQIGNGAIYGRQKLWCARFVNWLLEHAGYRSIGSDAAKSFLHFPHTSARVGAIAVLWRKGGGHVGIVSGFDHAGNPVLISGNHGHRVNEATYPRSRVLAYVVPADSHAAPDKAPNTIADFEPDDAAHRRIVEVPPVRVRQRVVSNGGEAEITPGTGSSAVSRTAMLQGSNRASRSEPPAGQEWKSQEWKSQEWKSEEWKSQEQNSWEQRSSEQNSWEHNSWEQKTQEKGKEQKGQGQKSQGQKRSDQKSWEQNSWEQRSSEQNSWEHNSWEQKTQEKGKEQKGQGQKSSDQKSWERNSSDQNSWEQNSWEQRSSEQNSWEQNSWEQKTQEKGKEQKGKEQKSGAQQNGEQVSQSEPSPPIRPGAL
jgi:uncharacterized protein (TIGR02594 family)